MAVLATVIAMLCCLVAAPLTANAATMDKSDAAGKGMAAAFGVLNAGVLLIGLGGLLACCWGTGRFPPSLALLMLLAIAAVGAGWFVVFAVRARHQAMRWLFVGPCAATLLVVALALWRCWGRGGVIERVLVGECVAMGLAVMLGLFPWIIQPVVTGVLRRAASVEAGADTGAGR